LKYWRRQPYLGFGLDAHSMVHAGSGAALRFSTTDVLAEYLRGDQVKNVRQLGPGEELEEAWFLGLRLRAGVAWQALAAEFGSDQVENFLPLVRELRQLELLTDDEGVVRLTRRGLLFSNDVFARFLEVGEQELQMQ
jgi:oxygen-independent coproporphyrinogen-3 oxidase